jgi:hypothetical protein
VWTTGESHFVVRYYPWVDIHESARKHGISDADIEHAVRHRLFEAQIDEDTSPPWRVLVLGPDRTGNLLEIILLERDSLPALAIHAIRMRSKYRHLLPRPGAPEHG